MNVFQLLCVILVSGVNLFISSFKLMENYYPYNIIDIYVSPCPQNVDCTSMLFEANKELQVPGNYRHINWHFNNLEPFSIVNKINTITFKNDYNYKARTSFEINNNEIVSFKTIISTYSLTTNALYNTILHEMSHIYLLDHGSYSDSITGYKLTLMANNQIYFKQKLQLTKDDCLGLYAKLIDDIIINNNQYALYLENMRDIYCPKTTSNNLVELDPSLLSPSLSSPSLLSPSLLSHAKFQTNSFRRNTFPTTFQNKLG